MKNLKEIVKTKDKDDNDIELAVLHPTYDMNKRQQLEHNKLFKEALDNGCILRESLEKYMRAQNLWDDEKQEQYEKLQRLLLRVKKSWLVAVLSSQKPEPLLLV